MANLFASKPELAETFPAPVEWDTMWVCPETGIEVPKHRDRNLLWRADLLEEAENDAELQQALYTAASKSVLFFVNAFVFTRRVFDSDDAQSSQAEDMHVPMVTWDVQDRHLKWIEHKIVDGEDGLTDKSRDMGATWNHLVVMLHRFLFRPDELYLMISRKEDAVDALDGKPTNFPFGSIGDPGTLFGKLDYVLARLPEWMLPSMTRKLLHLTNKNNGARIDGESSNSTAGSSDRRTAIFLDEMAKMQEGESIKRSTRAVTACRLGNSTPNGAGTAFSKWRLSGTIEVFVLPWWEHPEKGTGRYIEYLENTDRYRIRSPWYDHEAMVMSPKELAIEVDMDHLGSGDTFFEEAILEEHRKNFGCQPSRKLAIDFRKATPDDAVPEMLRSRDHDAVIVRPPGPWKLWCELPGGRPDQTKNYIFGIDISKGQGASNSVVSVLCQETREKVAEFADANTPPYTLARMVCAAALWFGGERGLPYIVWENNGDPGFDFGKQLVHLYFYPRIYFARVTGTVSEKRGKRYGWRSDREQKAACLGMLRRAYAHGGIINHSDHALDEAKMYVHFSNGGIGPAELVEESATARQAHGDRVIADMLCLVGAGDSAVPKKKKTRRPPEFSIGGRKQKFRKNKKAQKKQTHFDFR